MSPKRQGRYQLPDNHPPYAGQRGMRMGRQFHLMKILLHLHIVSRRPCYQFHCRGHVSRTSHQSQFFSIPWGKLLERAVSDFGLVSSSSQSGRPSRLLSQECSTRRSGGRWQRELLERRNAEEPGESEPPMYIASTFLANYSLYCAGRPTIIKKVIIRYQQTGLPHQNK